MSYIRSDGTVGSIPWYKRATRLAWGFVDFVVVFFRTLVNPSFNGRGNQYITDYRNPSQGPPPAPRRRVGGFATLSSCTAPMPGGG